MATYTWTGPGGVDWSVPGDWSPAGGPPGGADVAIIQSGGTVSIGEAQSIDVLSLAAGAMLSIASGAAFTVAGSITNGGALFEAGTLVVSGPLVTLDGGGAIGLTGTADTSALLAAGTGDTLVNVNETISGGGTLGGGTLGLANDAGGVIDAFAFFAAPATLDLDVAGTLANAGLIEATTGSLNSSGPVANSGTVEAAGNALALNGGADNSGLIDAAIGTLDLQGTVNNSGTITATGGTLNLTGALDNSTGTIDAASGTAGLNGTIENAALITTSGGTLEVQGTTGNTGTIESTGGTLDLQGTINNTSTIAASGGTIELQGAVDNSGGTIEASGGTLDLSGQVNNTGGTIASVGSGITLDGGTVSGGTLAGTFAVTSGTLDGSASAITGTGLTNPGSASMVLLNYATLTVLGSLDNVGITLEPGSLVQFASPSAVLSGGVSVSEATTPGFEGRVGSYPDYRYIFNPAVPSTIEPATAGQVLTNFNDTIGGGGTISGPLINDVDGVVDADQPTYPLSISGSISNDGLMEATSNELFLTGVIDQSGGGTLGESGNLVAPDWVSIDGTVIGGTLAGPVSLTNATLDGAAAPVTNTGDAEFNNLSLLGAIDNVGSIVGGNGNTLVVAAPTVTLVGAGELSSSGDNALFTAAATGDLLVNVNNTITETGTLDLGGDGMLALDNRSAGLIEGGDGALIDPLSLANEGAVEATAGTLTINTGSLGNTGIIEANGGTLVLAGGTDSNLAGTWAAVNSTIVLPSPANLAQVAGYVVLEGAAAEFVSSSGTDDPPLTNSYLAPQTILPGGALVVFSGATFGIDREPGGTIVVGGTTFFGGTLLPFGNAGLLELGAGTADLVATVTNTGTMFGYGSLTVSGAVMNNAGGTVEANGGLLTFQGTLTGGQLAVDRGATLDLSPGWFGGGGAIPLSFDGVNDLLQINVTDNAGTFSGVGSLTVGTFLYGETIAVDGTVAGGGTFPGFTSITNDGTTLTFIEAGQTLGTLAFAGGTSHLVLSQDSNHDEIITTSAYTWTGSSGADWSVAGDWSPAGGPPGITDGAIIPAGGTVSVGEAQSIDVLSLAAGAMLNIAAGAAFTAAGSIDDGGAIVDLGTLLVAGPSVEFGGGGTIGLTGTADTSALLAAASGDTLVNINDTISGGGTLGGGTLGLTNEAGGVIDAVAFSAAPATLDVNVAGTLLNAGLIEGTTGTLDMSIAGPVENSGTMVANGTVSVSGPFANSGMVEVNGGAFDLQKPLTNTGTLQVAAVSLDLTGLLDSNPGAIEVLGLGTVTLSGTFANSGTIATGGGSLDTHGTLTGAGVFDLQGMITNTGLITSAGTLTLGPEVDNTTGTIDVSRGTLDLPGLVTNASLIETTGGTLDLPGTVGNTSLIDGITGSLLLPGIVDNAGGTILSVAGAVTLDGTISGGTVAGFFAVPTGTLDIPLVNPGTLTIDSSVRIGLTTNSLDLVGTVINNSTVAVSQTGTIVNGSIDLLGTLDNTGVLSGGGPPGHPFVFSGGGSIDNTGTIAATAGGTFTVQGYIFSTGVMDGTSGSLILQGPIYSPGGTIEGATTDGQVTIDGPGELDGSAVPIHNIANIIAQGGDVSVLGSIDNAGTITTVSLYAGPPLYFSDSGVLVVASPTVTLGGGGQVQLSGRVVGDADNAIIAGATGEVLVNVDNTISGQQGIGAGGLVLDNQAAGLIEAMGSAFPMTLEPVMTLDPIELGNAGTLQADGATLDITAGTFTNTGTVFGNGLITSGAVMNNAGGTVEANGGLLTFQGALTGGQLAVDAGATLQLSSGWFGGGGAIPVLFDAGNDLLQLDVTDTAGTFSAVGSITMASFIYGDTIAVDGTVSGGGTFPGFSSITNDGTTLAFIEAGQTLGTLGFAGGTAHLVLSQDANHDEIITAACFAAGTRILTHAGEVPVEALRIGATLPTLRGGHSRKVRWLGHRQIDCRRHPRPREVWPIRVQPGAFAPGAPHQFLLLSPDHAVYVDEVLIPVRYLINGASIAQVETATVTYWHLELDRHDVVLAEGLAAESYLDTGNRSAFANGGDAIAMHADFARRVWQQRGCAPLVLSGPRIAQARRTLLARAALLGHACTDDAGLRVMVDGRQLPAEIEGNTWRVRLPPGTHAVRLVSRTLVPAHMQADADDHRVLGVAVARISLDGRNVALDDPRLVSGWHGCETGAGANWRWTNGIAGLALAGERTLTLEMVTRARYWVATEPGRSRLA